MFAQAYQSQYKVLKESLLFFCFFCFVFYFCLLGNKTKGLILIKMIIMISGYFLKPDKINVKNELMNINVFEFVKA